MLMDWKNEYITQSNLQTQHNPYQTTSGIFHRARANNFTICMETHTQKTLNRQSNLEKEWNWRNQPALLPTILQSYILSSGPYSTGTKTEIQINGTKQKAQRLIHTPVDTLFLIKEAKIYNGEKTISLISRAGKTGQPPVKNETRILSNTIQKINKMD